jgi:DNA adenine methylase
MPRRALLNDVNAHLINFYRWLKRGLRIDIPMRQDRQLFYEHRQRFNSLVESGRTDTAEAAASATPWNS